jgi:DNA polymerase bacteriophage-type
MFEKSRLGDNDVVTLPLLKHLAPVKNEWPRYPIIHRDIETRSLVDLKKVGAHVYAEHPSTQIIVAVWIIEWSRGELSEPIIWHANLADYRNSPPMPAAVRGLIESGCTVAGHNAAFEAAIDTYHAGPRLGWPVVALERQDCTMARAAVQSLPLDLDRLCRALNLRIEKDKAGHRLMLQMCKPRKPRKGELEGVHWFYDAERLARLTDYCVTDVRTEIEADHILRPLQEQERKVWELDQVMNNRGVEIDRAFVLRAEAFVERAGERANARIAELTGGAVRKVTEVEKIKDFAKRHGVEIKLVTKTDREGEEYEAEAADKEALTDLLARDLPGVVREVFQLRLEAGKSSLKKLAKFRTQAPKGRARGNLQYHAAGPGRWAGRGIQLQNLVRAGITEEEGGWDQAYEDMCNYCDETFEMIWGSPFDVVSRMMRGAVISKSGHKLYFGDYASVEARGCVWAAGQKEIVDIFARDGKIYEETAADIFRIPVEDVTKDQRFLGKNTVLGCGYGMGWPKFQATCKKQGRVITDELAQKAVYGWRDLNYKVAQFWDDLEDASKAAIENPGQIFRAGPFACRSRPEGRWLQCQLPSGRFLWYRDPSLKWAESANGKRSRKIHYWGINGYTKQWDEESTWGGKLLENCIQGMCRDFLAAALLRLEEAGYNPILSVHDEAICEVSEDFGSVKEFLGLMTQIPPWAIGFPLRAEGGSGNRYAKG